MDQSQSPASSSASSNPARSAVTDLFDLYLGKKSIQKSDDSTRESDGSTRESSNKSEKHVFGLNQELPPLNEQFLLDYKQLYGQFHDHDELRVETESVIVLQVVHCSNQQQHSDFLLFALRSLCSVGHINLDKFLSSLLSTVQISELSSNDVSYFLSSSSASLLPSVVHGIGPPTYMNLSPDNSSDMPSSGQQAAATDNACIRDIDISSLRQLCCKIVLVGLEFILKPVTHAYICTHMLSWLVNLDKKQLVGGEGSNSIKSWRSGKALEWLHSCLDVIWLLVDEEKCLVPFYELLLSGLEFTENTPADKALFTLILEIHKRRDMMAMNMKMLDQHLHVPPLGTYQIFSQTNPSLSGEGVERLRYSALTYPSILGEPLHGEDLAVSIPQGSLDWERALRCLRHSICTTPSPDWWNHLMLVAPCYRVGLFSSGKLSNHQALFTSEMVCEATIDRIAELLKMTNSNVKHWQDWLVFSDLFFFLMKGCNIDFVDKLVSRLTESDPHILRTNHVTWLLAQVIWLEPVRKALNSDTRKLETARKILSLHREDKNLDPSSPQSILLDLISSCQTSHIWSLNATTREYLNEEQLQKGKAIDVWWRQASKGFSGEHMMNYMNLDDKSIGMFWVGSYTMTQPDCKAVINWLSSAGVAELIVATNQQPDERFMVMCEVNPLPMSLLSGFAIHLCLKLAYQIEEALFFREVVPNIAMAETYCRLLLIAPHSVFRFHLSVSLEKSVHITALQSYNKRSWNLREHCLVQRSPDIFSKPGATLLMLEILNYRLLPLYRYQGKTKALMYDVIEIISALKSKCGDHRVFRLAENLCMNLIFSMQDYFLHEREMKALTESTETLTRATVVTLAIIIKTRGIGDDDHVNYLETMLEQILRTSTHTWSKKTLRYFPSLLRDMLGKQVDTRGIGLQDWQKQEPIVIRQCIKLLSSSADPMYVKTYVVHTSLIQRRYLCAGAWILRQRYPESLNSANLACLLRVFSPEEITANVYMMVDILLHHFRLEIQQGHPFQDLLLTACANLTFFVWTHGLLPLDLMLLALIDRDDDPYALHIVVNLLNRQELQQRVNLFCMNRGAPEHWLYSGTFGRFEVQRVLGNHLSWSDRYPTFFDDFAARLLPVIPLIVYRLIENDAMDSAERVLAIYTPFLAYHPFRFTFVRNILAYFYGHLPGKLIVRILNVLDISKVPLSKSFQQHIGLSNPVKSPPPDYFTTLLLGLVNNVIPRLYSKSISGSASPATSQSKQTDASDGWKPFYQIQDPGTYTQLVLDTAVIELLSLPASASQIVSSLVQIVVNIQSTLIQSRNGLHGATNSVGQGSVSPTSSSRGSTDPLGTNRSSPSVSGTNVSSFVSQSGYTCQQLSCLLIQACGLLLAQLPPDFHVQLYVEASRIIKETWWLADGNRSLGELDSALGYSLLDPTWAAEDNTSTAIGNIVSLLHSFFSNLPIEWVEGTHLIIKHLRPLTSVAMLRVAFRIMTPLFPKLANAHILFKQTLMFMFSMMADVFGKDTPPVDTLEIRDIIDFFHHIVHFDGQRGPVEVHSMPRPDVLVLCEKAALDLRPEIRHLLSHLNANACSSIYAAMHPDLAHNTS